VDWAAFGAFLSGIGAVLGAGLALRRERKRLDAECEQRLKAFRDGLAEGEAAIRWGAATSRGERRAGKRHA